MQKYILADKSCPKCGKILIEETIFCKCGFFLKSAKNSRVWTILLTTWVITGIISISFLLNLEKANKKISPHYNKINSISPIEIQIINSLKYTPYDNYIQNIYIKPGQDNKLIVLIKPSLWNNLDKTQKKELLNLINNSWIKIHAPNKPGINIKTKVMFGNKTEKN